MDGLITCQGKSCGRKFGYILKHLSQSPECKNAYSHSEYENLQKESKRITYENKLNRERSLYDKEKRAKKYKMQRLDKSWMKESAKKKREKYQIQKNDKRWMQQRASQKRVEYDSKARAKYYDLLKERQHREKIQSLIKREKKKICQQNESCKKEVTKFLQFQVKNLKATKLCIGKGNF